jgi:hypothetical protein
MPWNKVPREIEMLRPLRSFGAPFFETPFGEEMIRGCKERAAKFREAVQRLRRAQAAFQQALEARTTSGQGELRYVVGRTEGYIHHLQTLSALDEAYEGHRRAFSLLGDGLGAFRPELQEVLARARSAEVEAAQSAAAFATCAEHPTDLGVLWMINSSMVVGTRVYRQFVENLVAYYEGREYWNPVDWGLLFGENPFPLYALDRVEPVARGDEEEPG